MFDGFLWDLVPCLYIPVVCYFFDNGHEPEYTKLAIVSFLSASNPSASF